MPAPPLVTIPVDKVNPNTSWVLFARVNDPRTDLPITQSGITSIAYTVHQPSSATAISGGTGTLDKTVVVFDRLQTNEDDARFTATGAGFNFRWSVAPSLTPTAGLTYRYRVKIVYTDGSTAYIVRDRSAIDWGGPAA